MLKVKKEKNLTMHYYFNVGTIKKFEHIIMRINHEVLVKVGRNTY